MDNKITLIKFIPLLIRKIRDDSILAYAYHLTYNLLLSFFPFLIFLMTLVGFADLDSSAILSPLESYLPNEVYKLISDIVIDVVDQQRNGLMSFSILLAVYSASGGFRSFMEGTNKAMGVSEKRNIFIRYLLSVFWVILFSFAIVLALLGIVFGQQIINMMQRYSSFLPFKELLEIFRIVIPEIVVFLLILAFYMLVPGQKVCFRCAISGAIFTTTAWNIFTIIFQFYVNTYANYSKLYGALGAVIALLLWLLLTSMIMLIGVEINALLMDLEIVKNPAFDSARKSREYQ